MIARPSQPVPESSRPICDETVLAPGARRAELALLLAVGALRALRANTARPVAQDGEPDPDAAVEPARFPLAALAPAEPACGNTRARVPPAGRVPTRQPETKP